MNETCPKCNNAPLSTTHLCRPKRSPASAADDQSRTAGSVEPTVTPPERRVVLVEFVATYWTGVLTTPSVDCPPDIKVGEQVWAEDDAGNRRAAVIAAIGGDDLVWVQLDNKGDWL